VYFSRFLSLKLSSFLLVNFRFLVDSEIFLLRNWSFWFWRINEANFKGFVLGWEGFEGWLVKIWKKKGDYWEIEKKLGHFTVRL